MGSTQGLRNDNMPAATAISMAGKSDASKISIPNMMLSFRASLNDWAQRRHDTTCHNSVDKL
jgi:hypothetical protein